MSYKKEGQNFNKSMKPNRDEIYTVPILVNVILKYIKPNSTIFCPFDTESSEFVIIFKEAGHRVIHSHISEGKDFFKYVPEEDYDYIISNPPFTLKLEILEKLYDMNKPFAFLLPLPCLNYQNISNFFL